MVQMKIAGSLTGTRKTLFRDPTIRFLFACGVMLIATIAVSAGIVVSHYRALTLTDNERELKNIVLILSEQIDRTFQSLDQIQNGIAESIGSLVSGSTNDFSRALSSHDVHLLLKEKANGLMRVDSLSVVDSDGNLQNFAQSWPVQGVSIADRDYFKTLKSDPQLMSTISRPIKGRLTGEWSIFHARKMVAPNGEFRGLVIGTIVTSYFEKLFSSIVLGGNGSITLYRHDGIVLARYPQKQSDIGQVRQPGSSPFNDSDGTSIGYKSLSDSEGRDSLLAAHRVAHYPLYVAVELDVYSALSAWRKETALLFASAALAVIFIAIIFILVVRRIMFANGVAQQTLSSERQKLSAAINNMSQGLILFDEAERMVVCNDRFIEMYGLSTETVKPGCAFREVIVQRQAKGNFSGDVDKYCSARSASIAQKKSYEFRSVTEQGRTIRIVSRPVPDGGWLTTHEDITEERRREESFRLLFESSPVPMWVFNRETLGFLAVNDACVALFGYSREQFHTMKVFDLSSAPSKDVEAFLKALPDFKNGGRIQPLKTADGSTLQIESYSRVLDYENTPARLVAVHNVTDRILAEDQLRHSQKMEAVGQLTGGIAHDFNNLLTIILGNAELLTESLPNNPDLKSLAETTLSAAQRGAELIRRLLAFARQQPLNPVPTDVNGVINRLNGLIRPALGGQIPIHLSHATDLWPASVDKSQLENALLNLCINARDAMPLGGSLAIQTQNVEIASHQTEGSDEIGAGKYILITVSDTGTGMTPEVLKQAFDPFFTTKDVGKGSGLGLSMIFGFIKQSNGHVIIESTVGVGTSVKLYLPAAGADSIAEDAKELDSSIPNGSEKILYVEDDEQVRAHVRAQLTSLGYEVVTAGDGLAGIALLKQVADFDLLFTDVMMPGGVNGRELADLTEFLRPGLPVLFTSGYSDDAVIHNGRLDPGTRLLLKPFRLGELAREIRQVLDSVSELKKMAS